MAKPVSLLILILLLILENSYAQDFSEEIIANDNIKTVTCYGYDPVANFQNRIYNSPVINLNGSNPVILEFDDLRADYTQFRVKIIHCEADWQKSNLSDIEFLDGFNEFIINDYDVSEASKIPYYHYSFKIPKVKIAGNYVVQVFENQLGQDLIIQKKFNVYEPKVSIAAVVQNAQDPSIWKQYQQINLQINAYDYFISFPKKELKVFIRQNQRNDRIIELDNNLLYNTGNNSISYNFFKNEHTFAAGNEFRVADISASFANGSNVSKTIAGVPNQIFTITQKTSSNLGYVNSFDQNGNFLINNFQNSNFDISSDYVNLTFQLQTPIMEQHLSPSVYGKFNNWNPKDGKMEFNDKTGYFEKTVLLKNGIYDFSFTQFNEVENSTNDSFFEGNFSDTENNYEIFVYQKAPNFRSYQLIGYQFINFNANNK